MMEHDELASADTVERIREYTEPPRETKTRAVLADVWTERERQDEKWGEQNPPDGTGGPALEFNAGWVKAATEDAFAKGAGTWRDILLEEVAEAFAEEDPAKLREELVQVAAVAVAWIEAIDRRQS